MEGDDVCKDEQLVLLTATSSDATNIINYVQYTRKGGHKIEIKL